MRSPNPFDGGALLSIPRTDSETGVVKLDPWLEPFQDSLKRRYAKAQDWIKKIDETEGGLEKFSKVRPDHAGFLFWHLADHIRGLRSSDCGQRTMAASSTGSGRPMPFRPRSSATSVSSAWVD